jgi:hypothetical protein
MPRTLNPMDGCPDCKWLEHRGERHLDQGGICDLHKAIARLQDSYAIERQAREAGDRIITEICAALGASDDDSPIKLAQERMEEIAALEDALAKAEADYAKLLAAA